MKLSCHIEGLDLLTGEIQKFKGDIIGVTKKACLQEAQEIMAESLEEVPVYTGALRDSAFIEQDSTGDVTFGYGGNNAQINEETGQSTEEYMMTVHERLDVYHPVGKAKFLEDPINRRMEKLEESLSEKIRRLFRF